MLDVGQAVAGSNPATAWPTSKQLQDLREGGGRERKREREKNEREREESEREGERENQPML